MGREEEEKRMCRQAEFDFNDVDNVRILLQGEVFDQIFRKSQKMLSIEMDIYDRVSIEKSIFSNESIFVDWTKAIKKITAAKSINHSKRIISGCIESSSLHLVDAIMAEIIIFPE